MNIGVLEITVVSIRHLLLLKLACQLYSVCEESYEIVKLGQGHGYDERINQGNDINSMSIY